MAHQVLIAACMSTMIPCVATALLLLLSASRPAMADEVGVRSYRSQTLATDALSLGLIAGGGLLEGKDGRDTTLSQGMLGIGIFGAVTAVPLTHALRGNSGRAVASFALRVGLLNAGIFLALKSNDGCQGFLCELDHIGFGVLGGLTAAAIIDNALFPYETVERKTVSKKVSTRMIAPQISAGRNGGLVGLGGTF